MQKNLWMKKDAQNKDDSLKIPVSQNSKVIVVFFILILIILALVILLVLVVIEKEELNNSLIIKENSFLSEKNTLIEKISLLEKQKSDLELNLSVNSSNFDSLDKQNSDLTEKYGILKGETTQTILQIEEYIESMSDSMEWFSTNSFFDDSFSQQKMESKLKSNCVEDNAYSCEIKTACLDLVGSKEFGSFNFSYKLDEKTSNKTDYLQSLSEFFESKGGDCEDFSLIFKAQMNYLTNFCKGKEIIIESFIFDESNRNYYLDFEKNWYFDSAKAKKLSPENIFPVIVCGNMYDLQSQEINGHCVVAFTSKKIVFENDIYELVGAEMVEPQGGEYVGVIKDFEKNVDFELVNENYDNIYLMNEKIFSKLSLENKSYIHTVITDNDLFHFSQKSKRWDSFGWFSNKLIEQKQALLELINN